MKQRVFTGLLMVLVVLSAFLFRELSVYIFDVFVVGLTIWASYEFSKLLSKCNLYNSKIVAMIYPIFSYLLLILTIQKNMKFYFAFVLQVALLMVVLIGMISVFLIFKKTTDNEIKTRNLKIPFNKFCIYKGVHTLFTMLYPTIMILPLFLLNHIGQLGITSANIDTGLLGLTALLFAIIIPMVTDIFCMLCGSFFKGPKLCPKISPNKTISGAIGGIFFAELIMLCLYMILDATNTFGILFSNINLQLWHIIVLTFVASVFCQLGDLFESFVKRKANVKDSGTFLPGHGGILDRIDSHIFSYFIILFFFLILL